MRLTNTLLSPSLKNAMCGMITEALETFIGVGFSLLPRLFACRATRGDRAEILDGDAAVEACNGARSGTTLVVPATRVRDAVGGRNSADAKSRR